MAIYEYICEKCNQKCVYGFSIGKQPDSTWCHFCGENAKLVIAPPKSAYVKGKGLRAGCGTEKGICTTLPGEPVYVKNQQHFKELCKERSEEYNTDIHPA